MTTNLIEQVKAMAERLETTTITLPKNQSDQDVCVVIAYTEVAALIRQLIAQIEIPHTYSVTISSTAGGTGGSGPIPPPSLTQGD